MLVWPDHSISFRLEDLVIKLGQNQEEVNALV